MGLKPVVSCNGRRTTDNRQIQLRPPPSPFCLPKNDGAPSGLSAWVVRICDHLHPSRIELSEQRVGQLRSTARRPARHFPSGPANTFYPSDRRKKCSNDFWPSMKAIATRNHGATGDRKQRTTRTWPLFRLPFSVVNLASDG